jgi:hypothetical protein
MPQFRQWTDRCTINVALSPVSKSAGTTTSSAIDLTGFQSGVLVVNAGVIGSSETVDCKVQSSATSGGTYADITGAAIVQMTQAGGDSNTTQNIVFQLDVGKPHVKTVLVNATAAAIQDVLIIADRDNRT